MKKLTRGGGFPAIRYALRMAKQSGGIFRFIRALQSRIPLVALTQHYFPGEQLIVRQMTGCYLQLDLEQELLCVLVLICCKIYFMRLRTVARFLLRKTESRFRAGRRGRFWQVLCGARPGHRESRSRDQIACPYFVSVEGKVS